MMLASNKTKFVCTIGPASEYPDILQQMLHAGMNVARINFSHGIKRRSTPCLLAVGKPVGNILFINDGVIQPLHHRTGTAKNPFLQKAYVSRCGIWSVSYTHLTLPTN